MFAQKNRLPLTFQSKTNPVKGSKIHTSFFTLVYGPNTLGYLRVAAIVSKKVSTKAVVRNSVKRRLLEAVKQTFNASISNDLLFITKPEIKDLSFDSICSEINKVKHEMVTD